VFVFLSYRQSSVLIAKLLPEFCQQDDFDNQKSSVSLPLGHFVILPSPDSSLLIKSIAVSELMLPFDVPAMDNPDKDNLSIIADAVSKVSTVYVSILPIFYYTFTFIVYQNNVCRLMHSLQFISWK
jgi:hypothetical protein